MDCAVKAIQYYSVRMQTNGPTQGLNENIRRRTRRITHTGMKDCRWGERSDGMHATWRRGLGLRATMDEQAKLERLRLVSLGPLPMLARRGWIDDNWGGGRQAHGNGRSAMEYVVQTWNTAPDSNEQSGRRHSRVFQAARAEKSPAASSGDMSAG